MINQTVIMGRLCADPELRSTNNDVSFTSFVLAVDRDYVKQGEERQADFIPCTAWRSTADFICKYFSKGDMVALAGSLATRKYEDKDGNKRTIMEVIVAKASFCGSKKTGSPEFSDVSYSDEDLPF